MNDTTDWYAASPITDRCAMLTEAEDTMPSNAFVVRGEERDLLVDTGLGVGDLRGFVRAEYGERPLRVLLTHSHWDHIGNAHQFDDVVVHPRERTADGEVTIDVLSDEFVDRPAQFVRDRTEAGAPFPDGFEEAGFGVPPARGVGVVEGGDVVDLGDRTLEVVGLPGHSPGQVGLLDETDGVFYGADLVHVDRNCFVHFEDSSLADHAESLRTVADLRDEGRFETLVTGHNPPLPGDDLDVLDEMYDASRSVLEGDSDYEVVETAWGDARRYVVGDAILLTSLSPGTD